MTFLAPTPHKHVQFLIGQRHSILKVKNKIKDNDCILQLDVDSTIILKRTVGVPGDPTVEGSLKLKYSVWETYNHMGHNDTQETFKTYGHLHYVVPTLMFFFFLTS